LNDSPRNNDNVTRDIERLSAERTALFGKANGSKTLSDAERRRLREIEQALDERFKARRAQRAARDSQRFAR
jgi:hypothetical protein